MILTVDLASKLSAAMVRDRQREVHCDFNSVGKSSFQFVREIKNAADKYDVEFILIEDLPYGISSQAMTKPVTRLQGVLILALYKHLDNVFFVNPSTWQKAYPGVGRAPKEILSKSEKDAYRVEAARAHAERLGYTPPDLVAEYAATLPAGTKILKKNTAVLAKAMTDHVDAFLMADWAQSFASYDAVKKAVGVQEAFI